jgi:hypothetical protein
MATDLKDENEKLQGENDLLSKRLETRDGELLECKKDLFKCTRKLRELETLQATAVSEYPAEGLRAVQARPVEGGQSLEAVEAVAVSKMGGAQVTQGWTQIIGGSAYSGQPSPVGGAGIREPTGYLNRKKEIQRMGLIGWSERNSVTGYGDWWPRDQTRDPTEMLINTPVEGHSDTYISPGIDFRTLVDVSKERRFKLVFEHPDDIQAARFFELDFEEREEQGGGSRKKRSKRKRSQRTKRKRTRSKRRITNRKRTKRKRTNRRRSKRRISNRRGRN